MDNFQRVTSNENDLLQIYEEANKEMKAANMPLRQWVTNNTKLARIIQRDYPGYEIPDKTQILGLQWNVYNDTVQLKDVIISKENAGKLTKRSLLSKLSQVFDPLGLFTPITIRGKMLLQQAWKLKLDWDDDLPDEIRTQWESIAPELNKLQSVSFPRSIGLEHEELELHIFCDASSNAYGAVAYIVNRSRSLLLTSKARVSPLSPRTIPQLELTGLLIGTKLGIYINATLKELKLNRTSIWSDSE